MPHLHTQLCYLSEHLIPVDAQNLLVERNATAMKRRQSGCNILERLDHTSTVRTFKTLHGHIPLNFLIDLGDCLLQCRLLLRRYSLMANINAKCDKALRKSCPSASPLEQSIADGMDMRWCESLIDVLLQVDRGQILNRVNDFLETVQALIHWLRELLRNVIVVVTLLND